MTLKIGQEVTMNDRYCVSKNNEGRVFTVVSDPFDIASTSCVRLAGVFGVYPVNGLDLVEEEASYV